MIYRHEISIQKHGQRNDNLLIKIRINHTILNSITAFIRINACRSSLIGKSEA